MTSNSTTDPTSNSYSVTPALVPNWSSNSTQLLSSQLSSTAAPATQHDMYPNTRSNKLDTQTYILVLMESTPDYDRAHHEETLGRSILYSPNQEYHDRVKELKRQRVAELCRNNGAIFKESAPDGNCLPRSLLVAQGYEDVTDSQIYDLRLNLFQYYHECRRNNPTMIHPQDNIPLEEMQKMARPREPMSREFLRYYAARKKFKVILYQYETASDNLSMRVFDEFNESNTRVRVIWSNSLKTSIGHFDVILVDDARAWDQYMSSCTKDPLDLVTEGCTYYEAVGSTPKNEAIANVHLEVIKKVAEDSCLGAPHGWNKSVNCGNCTRTYDDECRIVQCRKCAADTHTMVMVVETELAKMGKMVPSGGGQTSHDSEQSDECEDDSLSPMSIDDSSEEEDEQDVGEAEDGAAEDGEAEDGEAEDGEAEDGEAEPLETKLFLAHIKTSTASSRRPTRNSVKESAVDVCKLARKPESDVVATQQRLRPEWKHLDEKRWREKGEADARLMQKRMKKQKQKPKEDVDTTSADMSVDEQDDPKQLQGTTSSDMCDGDEHHELELDGSENGGHGMSDGDEHDNPKQLQGTTSSDMCDGDGHHELELDGSENGENSENIDPNINRGMHVMRKRRYSRYSGRATRALAMAQATSKANGGKAPAPSRRSEAAYKKLWHENVAKDKENQLLKARIEELEKQLNKVRSVMRGKSQKLRRQVP